MKFLENQAKDLPKKNREEKVEVKARGGGMQSFVPRARVTCEKVCCVWISY